ncbi:MAG: Uma2 family endonuclease [Polyangiaceae bacterium]
MSVRAKKRASYEDLLEVPEPFVAEIIDGVLHVRPRPAKPHAAAASALGEELGPPFKRGRGGPGGWLILDEPELHLRDDIVSPDLAGWRRERMPSLDDRPYFELAPDWACEVLSRSTAIRDRTSKLSIYRREGVSHVWFVDPLVRTLEVLRRTDDGWLLALVDGGDVKVRAEPFDAIELDLAVLWQDVVLPDSGP